MTQTFKFGQRVRKKNGREVFLVLGTEPNGFIQIAAFNWKTAAKPHELEPA